MNLTPEIVEAAYEYLRTTPPFKGWKLPHADDVEFVITRNDKRVGHHRGYHRDKLRHEIGLSQTLASFTSTIMENLGHEMIHAYQHQSGTETPNTQHNAEFIRLARIACRQHGWDFRRFL